MNLPQMLADLRAERQKLEEAILVLERLAATGGRRRGRPPKWMASTPAQTSAAISIAATGKRKPFSAATRKKMAAAQRKRWAAKKAKA
jgi:hypothetical protein